MKYFTQKYLNSVVAKLAEQLITNWERVSVSERRAADTKLTLKQVDDSPTPTDFVPFILWKTLFEFQLWIAFRVIGFSNWGTNLTVIVKNVLMNG